MSPVPAVSIVMPVFNDEATLAASIESALAQTLSEIEVICVDDASTDGTAAVIQRFAERDTRVRLIRQGQNLSAFQARRAGILAATADHVLFLDGDDELVPHAAERALAVAHETEADLVGFGVTVIEKDGRTGGSYERRLQPVHQRLDGRAEVLQGMFPIGKPAQGQLWRYLFRTRVLREAYTHVPDDLVLPRINDLPLLFLVAALSSRYVSVDDRLYRYHFGRGGSGHSVETVEQMTFYASAVGSIDSIATAVSEVGRAHPDPELLGRCYQSARLSIIGYLCQYFVDHADSTMLAVAFDHLYSQVSARDMLRASSRFYPQTLRSLAEHGARVPFDKGDHHHVLIVTGKLTTGGVSGVVISQARLMRDAGHRVTILAKIADSVVDESLAGIDLVELSAQGPTARLAQWASFLDELAPDTVIDHHVLYSRDWPQLALLARAAGVPTIGWIHNFAGRPVYDGSGMLTILRENLQHLERVVVLSPLDVAFWKLQGIADTVYLPNPPSPLLLQERGAAAPRRLEAGRLELVWWGRLEQRTKQVRELLAVAQELHKRGVDFQMTVIGPDWEDLTAKRFNAEARKRGVHRLVRAVGPRRGDALTAAIRRADAFVNTSIIEGYPLTLVEAQSAGLPVFMYDLPWLAIREGNDGLVSVTQGDAAALAARIVDAIADPDAYEALSHAALRAAEQARSHDFGALYAQVLDGSLPETYSPAPTLADAAQLLQLMAFFSERSSGRERRRREHHAGENGLGARAWNAAAPAGRAFLRRFPNLRLIAHHAKRWVGAG